MSVGREYAKIGERACLYYWHYDKCVLRRDHDGDHLMLDFDYPSEGPNRREYSTPAAPPETPKEAQ